MSVKHVIIGGWDASGHKTLFCRFYRQPLIQPRLYRSDRLCDRSFIAQSLLNYTIKMPSYPKFPELYHNTKGDTNYDSWIINIKVSLRPKGLWACTQEALPEGASASLKNKHIDSADMITHYVSGGVKAKLPPNTFDDGYLMLTGIKQILVPAAE
jgi:hypothetical protein